jgi:hypothetical protein
LTLLDAGSKLCANDLIAAGALHELLSQGLRVPEDAALVGMEDTALAQMSFPQISSVSLGAAERGRIAAELLLSRLADPSLAPRRKTVAPALAVRASSAGAPGGTPAARAADHLVRPARRRSAQTRQPVGDAAGLAASCRAGRDLGFVGRAAIHPAQLVAAIPVSPAPVVPPVIVDAFRPSVAEVARATEVLAALGAAADPGRGTSVLADGRFVDVAMGPAAQYVVDLASQYPPD